MTENLYVFSEDYVIEKAIQATTRPDDFGWYGRDDMFDTWGFSGIQYNNCSDLLEEVNFEVISEDLLERFPDDFEQVQIGHWAVGKLHTLICRVWGIDEMTLERIPTTAFREVLDWFDTLDQYPIANEERYYERDVEAVVQYIRDFAPSFILNEALFAEAIYSYLSDQDLYMCYDTSSLPSEAEMAEAAYRIGLIDRNYQEEWDEFVLENSLPVINWERDNLTPFAQVDGQMQINFNSSENEME